MESNVGRTRRLRCHEEEDDISAMPPSMPTGGTSLLPSSSRPISINRDYDYRQICEEEEQRYQELTNNASLVKQEQEQCDVTHRTADSQITAKASRINNFSPSRSDIIMSHRQQQRESSTSNEKSDDEASSRIIDDTQQKTDEKGYQHWLSRAKKNGCSCLDDAPNRIKNDKRIVMAAVQQNGYAIQYVPPELQKDKEVVIAAVQQNGYAIQHVPTELQKDKEVVIATVQQNGSALQHVPPELQKDKEVAIASVQNDGLALEYVSPQLKNDREVVMVAIQNDGRALQFASGACQGDKDVVLTAIRQNAEAFKYASIELRMEKEVIFPAVSSDPLLLKHASGGMNQDPECLIAASLWDENYKCPKATLSSGSLDFDTSKKIVLSTRFSLNPDCKSQATLFAILLKNHEYIRSGNFIVYSPNAYDKSTCDPEWTRAGWPCRGTFDTCEFDPSLKMGEPQDDSCWRYSFRYQLEEAKRTKGFMIQLVESLKLYLRFTPGDSMRNHQTLGDGQKIEQEMARDLELKVFQVYAPIKETHGRVEGEYDDIEVELDFTNELIEVVVSEIREWYEGGCTDMSLKEIKNYDVYGKGFPIRSKQI